MNKPTNQILEILLELVENAMSEHDGFEFLMDGDDQHARYESEKKDLQMVSDWLQTQLP